MNSALQCLSNTPELRRYFLGTGICHKLEDGSFKSNAMFIDDLRPDNKEASANNEITVSFAKFLNSLWNKESQGKFSWEKSVHCPDYIKKAIGKKNCLFDGYSQNDTYELL